MSKSTLLDKIKNPDVPGFEEVLPPPPPPPPPPIISENAPEVVDNNSSNPPFPNVPPASYYMTAQAHIQATANQPWWLPTEVDTSEVYTQWYESAYKAALQSAQEKDCIGKNKVKYYKRKAEVIDPKVDAEKVANAQKELSVLMKPLKCDLCNAVMNSTLQARLHYQGKPHQKKVSMFLNQSAKKAKTEDGQVSSTTSSDWNTYCEICKIWFTSQTDASQHYAGKKHLKAAFGTKVKSPKKTQPKVQIDPTGRYGIGMAFQPEIVVAQPPLPPENPPIMVPAIPAVAPLPPVPQYSQPAVPFPAPLRCDLCGISANRQDQLDTHKRGTKHMKMLKLHGLPVTGTETTPAVKTIDYSIYRTPSGQYYCAPCNISLNSEISFGQHMESKKHKNQVNPKQPAPSSPVAKKAKKK
ncbi:zinc finger protein 346 [Nasonia vitripennis]|uniref:C2H2-type domain-containing protein n=1 Tax=Nasonia vitripennis TaxID=7425 RepID=A0A7M7IQ33_NASVI|nr:zinc finger protein 346 [Nasonia vitripennis]XP_016837941.1 zinc finger protein 346 [Nasonia vitripennis]